MGTETSALPWIIRMGGAPAPTRAGPAEPASEKPPATPDGSSGVPLSPEFAALNTVDIAVAAPRE